LISGIRFWCFNKYMPCTQEEKHERKTCPRCGHYFTCMMNNIVYCNCSQVDMPMDVMHSVQIVYQDCLCPDCLEELTQSYREKGYLDETDLFKTETPGENCE